MSLRLNHHRPRDRGFTLVELLVVIGIIALLIGILLPALSKARQAGYKTKCLANLHQIGLAMIMYTNDSKGVFPGSARVNYQRMDDFVYWEEPKAAWDITGGGRPAANPSMHWTAQQDQDLGVLSRYMGKHFVSGPWVCPADELNRPRSTVFQGVTLTYPYSYVMNDVLSCELPNFDSTTYSYFGRIAKMSAIRHSSSTVMMAEESEITIDDGDFTTVTITGSPGTWVVHAGGLYQLNWLASRHDSRRRNPDNILNGSDQEGIADSGTSGNVVFCDGHADYVTRQYVGSPTMRHWDWRF